MLKALKHELIEIADTDKAHLLSRFFKTGRGQHGEGDCFLGVTVPAQRRTERFFNFVVFILMATI